MPSCLVGPSHYVNQYWYTVYPKKYPHGFVVLCFVVVMQSFIMNSHEVFIHIHQGCFAGTGAIVRLPQCQWSKPDGYGKISQCITTTKHSNAKTVCIFLGIYCTISKTHRNSTQWNYHLNIMYLSYKMHFEIVLLTSQTLCSGLFDLKLNEIFISCYKVMYCGKSPIILKCAPKAVFDELNESKWCYSILKLNLVNIALGKGWLSNSIKASPEPVLSRYQQNYLSFIWWEFNLQFAINK